jgi:hypothetical protein
VAVYIVTARLLISAQTRNFCVLAALYCRGSEVMVAETKQVVDLIVG